MSDETQEIPYTRYDNLRVQVPAANKLREVQRQFKAKRRVHPTQTEALAIIADAYLAILATEHAQ